MYPKKSPEKSSGVFVIRVSYQNSQTQETPSEGIKCR